MSILLGAALGFFAWFLVRYLVGGIYTVDQNERAVKTSFGRAQRLGDLTTLDDPDLRDAQRRPERERYCYPAGARHPAGRPVFQMAVGKVYKISIATADA